VPSWLSLAGGPPEGPNGARGRLDVLDGGTVTVGGGDGFSQLVIGRDPGSDGKVRVAGNSQLTIRSNEARLYVGRDGLGTMVIESGSTVLVEASDGAPDAAGVQIAQRREADAAAGGSLRVDNATLIVRDDNGTFINVGTAGPGGLLVTNGGLVSIEGVESFLGIGRSGTGTLAVTGGGKVVMQNPDGDSNVFVAQAPSSIGTVIVDGAGSELDAGSFLAVGLDFDMTDGGTGTVSVRNGGVVRAAETRLGANGFLGANGTVVGDVVNQGGTVAPGLSPGTLTIDGNFVFETGILELEIGGSGVGEYDVLNVLGDASFLGGTILFSFVDGFLPETGDVFDVLLAAAISGLPNVTFDYAGLGDGFVFDFELGDDGLRFVALSGGDPIPTPELGALLLLLVGLVGLDGIARTRRATAPA